MNKNTVTRFAIFNIAVILFVSWYYHPLIFWEVTWYSLFTFGVAGLILIVVFAASKNKSFLVKVYDNIAHYFSGIKRK